MINLIAKLIYQRKRSVDIYQRKRSVDIYQRKRSVDIYKNPINKFNHRAAKSNKEYLENVSIVCSIIAIVGLVFCIPAVILEGLTWWIFAIPISLFYLAFFRLDLVDSFLSKRMKEVQEKVKEMEEADEKEKKD